MRIRTKTYCLTVLSLISVLCLNAQAEVPEASLEAKQLSLNKIMADPDWMGRSPQNSFWTLDGKKIIYSQKAEGHSHTEQFEVVVAENQTTQLESGQALYVASQRAKLNSAKTLGIFTYEGDIYQIDLSNSEILRLTADSNSQSSARFIDNTSISYLEGYKIFVLDLVSRLSRQVAEFKNEKDPQGKAEKSYLEQSQPRLIKYLAEKAAEAEFQKERNKEREQNKPKVWYLGDNLEIKTFRVSPNARWVLVGTVEPKTSGKSDHMPEFVTADGYVNDREVRSLVGTDKPTRETFTLFDLTEQKEYAIETNKLPGINDDPLESLKRDAAKKIDYKYQPLDKPRAVYAYNWSENGGVEWTEDSSKVAIELFSYDNKDRWIIGYDVKEHETKTLHWLTDKAWVNDWTFNQFGWLPDNQTLYFLSEEDGYSHLYIKKGKRRARQLTEGKFEVSDLTVSEDGETIYFKANKNHPGNYEVFRVAVKGGPIKALTGLGGSNDYVLSPDESRLLLTHSTTTQMPELIVQSLGEGFSVQQITETSSKAFKAIDWQAPEIVKVPSSKVDEPIYSRYYAAQSDAKKSEQGKKPAVIFVHGAGYLQNSHQGWSGYFREYMFHNLLTRQGYVVLDMDYRASKGYGRDWRTAIYRNMGTPELEDLVDGSQWLVKNADVDPDRIGVYGGSYGGFMTFMALFKEPEVFAAGAALRPVTDWAHYNHGYTSNILNSPQFDPVAYERSSPIEFAQGLNKPLLIAHGMVDDNVFFKDTVRLVQRLIELEKTPYFETAIYPVEPHSFVQPSSWLDEYTRIYQLFERELN